MTLCSVRVLRLSVVALVLLAGSAASMALAADKALDPPLQASGTVTHVQDGDTFELRTTTGVERVRVKGIDAPELGQPYSKVSRSALAHALDKQSVDIRCSKRDDYRRLVCNVFVAGRDIGLELVAIGLAWHFKRFANEQSTADQERYVAAESKARQEQRGLWKQSNPMPPWECRAKKRAGETCEQ